MCYWRWQCPSFSQLAKLPCIARKQVRSGQVPIGTHHCERTQTFFVVAAGGFLDERAVQPSERGIDPSALRATHEEADTRLIVYCVNSSLNNIVVSARDTDVLLLLVTHAPHIPCPNLYMMSGTAKRRKYFNIRAIYENLPAGSVSVVLPFHSLMGCETTFLICNHSKKSAWKVFLKHHTLLS